MKNVEDTAKEAGDRITDVFIGIDVWGRNFYGGGQFNVQEVGNISYFMKKKHLFLNLVKN